MKSLDFFILGNGRAGKAIAKSIEILKIIHPELKINGFQFLNRNFSEYKELQKNESTLPVFCISNPAGLHANYILEAAQNGIKYLICEKPACVNEKEIATLKNLQINCPIFHIYRQSWGIQTIKQYIKNGKIGEIISIDNRYWQSSSAIRFVKNGYKTVLSESWKNNIAINGNHDVLLDLSTHSVDAISYLMGEMPQQITKHLLYDLSESEHRDTHNNLIINFSNNKEAFASISKLVHGSTNFFEITVLGTKGTLQWNFMNSDQIIFAEGNKKIYISRECLLNGSEQMPFHSTGWLEGYIEIIKNYCLSIHGKSSLPIPTLHENLDIISALID